MRNMVARVKTLGKQWWHASFKMPLKRRRSHSFLRCACACVFMFMCVWVTVCFKEHERFFGFWCHCFQDFSIFFGGYDVSIILLMPRSLASMALGSANLRGEAVAISAGSVSLVPLPRVIFSSWNTPTLGNHFQVFIFEFLDLVMSTLSWIFMPSCRWPRFHQNFFRTCFIMCPKPAWGRAQRAVVRSREDVPWETWA